MEHMWRGSAGIRHLRNEHFVVFLLQLFCIGVTVKKNIGNK